MKTITIHDPEYTVSPSGVRFARLFAGEKSVVAHVILEPGQTLPPHNVPGHANLFVLEGNPTISIGDETANFGPGTLIESPANIDKELSNHSKDIARILVIREM